MPQAAEDLVDDLLDEYLNFGYWLRTFQEKVIAASPNIQDMQRWQAQKFATAVNMRLAKLNKLTQDYYRTRMDSVYLAGARSIDPTFEITNVRGGLSATRRQLAKVNLQEYLHLRNATQTTMTDTKRFMDMIWDDAAERKSKLGLKYRYVSFNPEATIRLRGIKAASENGKRRYEFGDYTSMVIRQNANRAYNMGVIHAAEKIGSKYLLVSDGPECGWTYHDDPETAQGKVVTLAEAAAFPVAHPNCRRGFSPATPDDMKRRKELKDSVEKKRGQIQGVKKAAEIGLISAAAVYTAASASNMLEIGIDTSLKKFAQSQLLDDAIKRMMQGALRGDPYMARMVQRLNSFREHWLPEMNVGDNVFPMYPGAPDGAVFPHWNEMQYYGQKVMNGLHDIPEMYRGGRAFTQGVLEELHLERIPKRVGDLLGKAEKEIVEELPDKIQEYYKAAKDFMLAEDNVENIFRVLEFERSRRKWFDFFMRNVPGTPEFRLNWTPYGNRVKANLTNWLRVGSTVTRTGPVSSLTAHAMDKSLRSVIRIYQDGLIGGHISVLPKKFAKGIFRAVVEIDQDGRLVGNIRMVPGGPLRVTLQFGQKSIREIIPSDSDLLAHANLLTKSFDWPSSVREKAVEDLRYLWKVRNHQLPLDMRDIRTSPIGFAYNVYERSKQFEFKQLVVNLRIFNQSVFDISTSLRIPVSETIAIMKKLAREGMVKEARIRPDGIQRYVGMFQYIVSNPSKAKEILNAGRATLFGNIRFSSLTNDVVQNSTILRTLKNLNVRILTKAQLEDGQLQRVVTKMRVHGWSIYDIGNVLEVKSAQVKYMLENSVWAIRNVMEDWGVLWPQNLGKAWQGRVWRAMVQSQRDGNGPRNATETLKRAVQAVTFKDPNTARGKVLQQLANVSADMPEQEIYGRLRHTFEWMRNYHYESPDLLDTLERYGTDENARAYAKALAEEGKRRRKLADKIKVHGISGGMDDLYIDPRTGGRWRSIMDKFLEHIGGNPSDDEWDAWAAVDVTRVEGRPVVMYPVYDPAHHIPPYSDFIEGVVDKEGVESSVKIGNWWIVKEGKGSYHVLDGDPAWIDDLMRESDFMAQRFPFISQPRHVYVMDYQSPAALDEAHGAFIMPAAVRNRPSEEWLLEQAYPFDVPQEYFYRWSTFMPEDQAKRIANNEITGRLEDASRVWIHEYSHYLTYKLIDRNPESLHRLAEKLSEVLGYDFKDIYDWDWSEAAPTRRDAERVLSNTTYTFLNLIGKDANKVNDAVYRELGSYANYNGWELLAEGERHFLTDPEGSGPVARVIGEWFDRELNDGVILNRVTYE